MVGGRTQPYIPIELKIIFRPTNNLLISVNCFAIMSFLWLDYVCDCVWCRPTGFNSVKIFRIFVRFVLKCAEVNHGKFNANGIAMRSCSTPEQGNECARRLCWSHRLPLASRNSKQKTTTTRYCCACMCDVRTTYSAAYMQSMAYLLKCAVCLSTLHDRSTLLDVLMVIEPSA